MKQLSTEDLDALKSGSALLGSGGGGDPSYEFLMVKYLIEQNGPLNMVGIEELKDDDVVVPIAFMGAPLVGKERLSNTVELEAVLKAIENRLGLKPTVLIPAEIGGSNAFTPLLIGSQLGLPVLDADLIGRAFPELQMNFCHLQKHPATPAVIADCLGNTVIIDTLSVNELEALARSISVHMGSSAAIGMHIMRGSDVKNCVVPRTYSQAIVLGEILHGAKKKGLDPISALIEKGHAHLLARGTLIDIQQEIKEGFLQGSAQIKDEEQAVTLTFQNEYLLASDEVRVLASTPDILMLVEEGTGNPITSEGMRYGLQVALVAIPAPQFWQTPEGLELVGPRVFGYETDYVSISDRRKNGL